MSEPGSESPETGAETRSGQGRAMRFYARISGAVFGKVLLAFTGFWVGDKLDSRYHTSPMLAMLLLIVGLGLGIWYVVWVAEKESKRG